MLMFREEVHMDWCYLLVVLKGSKKVVKRLCLDTKKRFSGAGRAGLGGGGVDSEMLVENDDIQLLGQKFFS